MKPGKSSHKQVPLSIHQEILLFKAGRYAAHPYLQEGNVQSGWAAALVQISCPGRLPCMFPDFAAHAWGWDLFPWQVVQGDHSLWIRQGTSAEPIDPSHSIDPCLILLSMFQN